MESWKYSYVQVNTTNKFCFLRKFAIPLALRNEKSINPAHNSTYKKLVVQCFVWQFCDLTCERPLQDLVRRDHFWSIILKRVIDELDFVSNNHQIHETFSPNSFSVILPLATCLAHNSICSRSSSSTISFIQASMLVDRLALISSLGNLAAISMAKLIFFIQEGAFKFNYTSCESWW